MSLGLRCGILLVCVNLLAGNIGNLSAAFRDCLALVLWLPVLVGIVWPGFSAASWRRRLAVILLLIPVLLGFAAGGLHAIFALFVSLLFPVVLTNAGSRAGLAAHDTSSTAFAEPGVQLLLLTAAAAGLVALAQQEAAWAFAVLERLSEVSCSIASLLSCSHIAFGPTYSGVPVILTVVACHLCVFALLRSRNPRRLALFLAGQCGLLLAYQGLFHLLLSRWPLESPWVLLGTAQFGLLLLSSALLVLQLRGSVLTSAEWRLGPWPLVWLGAASVLCFVSAPERLAPLFGHEMRPSVLLYDDGTLNWRVPVDGQYSAANAGMFGSLGPFLQRHGCDICRATLKGGALDRANVLVIFNLMRKFTPEEKRQIWDFVGKGGSLLAVGDHTGTTEIREPFNDLLEPVNIRLNFDCAMPIQRKWANGLRWFPHCVTARLDSEADSQIQVGASLGLGRPAVPLIIGCHGWSDAGDLQNRTNGYLGDRRFSREERLGDVVLVATARYRQGKVMVFGDTTTFQNGASGLDGNFVQLIINWLALKERQTLRFLTLLLFALAAAASVWSLVRARATFLSTVAGLFLCLYLASTFTGLANRQFAQRLLKLPPPGEAVIDVSHLSRCDPELWWPDGLGGLVQNLMRKNYLPVVASQFSPELLRQSRLSFLVAPAKAFSAAEVKAYDDFVRGGGELFICVGYEDSAACRELLRRFGFRLRNLPLGLLKPDSNDAKIYFLNAWPVIAEPGDNTVLCKQADYPLIVSRRYGSGRVVLIGDSAFFLNRNLEMAESFNPENIQFFKKVVPAHD